MRALLLAVLASALLAPAAQAGPPPCWCINWFADSYVIGAHRAITQGWVDQGLAARGIGTSDRRRVKEGIYDWRRQRDFSASWCKENRRACNAVKACLIAAGAAVSLAYSKDRAAGRPANLQNMAFDGAYACAAAAATALAVG